MMMQSIQVSSHTVVDSSYGISDSNEELSEKVIPAILAAREALEKPIEERDERDILLIDNLCSLVHGFDVFPKTVRRALAAQSVLIVIDEKGKELIIHNEDLDSFCVLIFGQCEQLDVTKTVPIRYYNIGDAFGVCEPTTETIKFKGYMITSCENCAFLCVKKDDFYTVLTDSANYPKKDVIRHRDPNGNIICISQFNIDKKSFGPLWSNQPHYSHSSNPFKMVLPNGHIIIKATESCLLTALVDGYDRVDSDYVEDFLLLFRVFMTHEQRDKDKKLPPGMVKLCLNLIGWLDYVNYRDKVVKIVLTWLSSYYHDFELNSDFSYLFFKLLESKLLNLKMNNQLHLLHVTLSTKSKARHVTISRSSREQPLTFSISGGYEKKCGIFVAQVYGSHCDDNPYNSMKQYLNLYSLDTIKGGPTIPPRNKSCNNPYNPSTVLLRPGDQILEVNGTNFAAIKLVDAQKKLDVSTHLSLTVKYNPSAFYEMKALEQGKKRPSLSSVSPLSPYQPPIGQNKFTFSVQDQYVSKLSDSHPPNSPLFSSNANFGFKSLVRSVPKYDKSKFSLVLKTSKKFVKQIRDSTAQSSSNNMEVMSKLSDNISDTQSNDIDLGKARSIPDLNGNQKARERISIESVLSNVVRLTDPNPASVTEQSANGTNQTLVNVLRIFNAANNEFRYVLADEQTTAREVVTIAVEEFNLAGNCGTISSPNDRSKSSLDWHLYEVSVVPESKTIKKKCLSEQTRVAERVSLCSRFYISNSQGSSGPSRLDMGDAALVNEIQKGSPANITLTSLNATLLAVELTLSDFDKFRSIEPQQYVYDTFFNYSERRDSLGNPTGSANGRASSALDSASLKSSSSDGQETDLLHNINKTRCIPKSWMDEYQKFADISNKEMFWVVCEILNERNIGRRVQIVRQFIRVADVCSQLRNYNSMFAIISGLGHSCIGRLRRTFEKLKPKYRDQLEKMTSFFDPSKNMSNYRFCLNNTPPPAIPLFPQIKKDLTFTKEGRSIFIRESNDLSDDDDSEGFSQSTIKRRSRGALMSVKSSNMDQTNINQTSQFATAARSVSYTAFNGRSVGSMTDIDSILINFAEVRQFTERVRNVIHFSSLPYSKDLLTNTKDTQRTPAQIKKMYEECQMRKRIRHYISQTLDNTIIDQSGAAGEKPFDQTDCSSTRNYKGNHTSSGNGSADPFGAKLRITYDEKILYQRSLDIEPELNQSRPQTANSAPERLAAPPPLPPIVVQSLPLYQPQVPPVALSMQPPASAANSSPTLSKSSSLSSCSSFNNHLPNYHASVRSNLTLSTVGKFGTESTESLRKLQALSENVDDWRSYHSTGSGNWINRANADQSNRPKGLVSSRIFPPKSSR